MMMHDKWKSVGAFDENGAVRSVTPATSSGAPSNIDAWHKRARDRKIFKHSKRLVFSFFFLFIKKKVTAHFFLYCLIVGN